MPNPGWPHQRKVVQGQAESLEWTRRGVWIAVAGGLVAVLSFFLGGPEALEAWRSQRVRAVEASLALSPMDQEIWTGKLRTACRDGQLSAAERESLRAAARTRGCPVKASLCAELRATAESAGSLFPPSLAEFVGQQTTRLCGAANLAAEGDRLLDSSNLAGAREKFLEATELDPANPIAWLNLGNTYQRMGRNADAVEALRQAFDLRAQGPRELEFAVRYSLGSALALKTGSASEALALIQAALDAYRAAPPSAPPVRYLFDDLKHGSDFRLLRRQPDFAPLLQHPVFEAFAVPARNAR